MSTKLKPSNLTRFSGATCIIPIVVLDDSDAEKVMTGATIGFELSRRVGSSSYVSTSADSPNATAAIDGATVTITIADTVTEGLEGTYYWEATAILAGFKAIIAYGEITFKANATGGTSASIINPAAYTTAAAASETAAAASASAASDSATASATSASASATSASASASSASSAATAQTAAELAETNAETAETNAETAQTAAEAARDAAIVNSTMYADIATGRAAVADTEYFKVIGSGDVACYEYVRVNASTSTLVATYPSKSFVDDTNLNSQRGRHIVMGEWTRLENTGAHQFTLSNERLYVLMSDGSRKSIAVQTDVVVNNNECMYVDIVTGATDGTSAIIPVVADMSTAAAAIPFLTGERLILFSNSYSILGGMVPTCANINELDITVAAQTAGITAAQDNSEFSRYAIIGGIKSIGVKNDGSSTEVISFKDCYLMAGSTGASPRLIRDQTNLEIPLGSCAYIDVAAGPDGTDGKWNVSVGPTWISTATYGSNGFVGDERFVLYMGNTSSQPGCGALMNNPSTLGPYFGHVVMPFTGCTVAYNETTRELSWSGDLYFQHPYQGSRLRLNAGSITIADTGALQVVYVSLQDVLALTDWNNADPALCVKQGRYYTGTDKFYGHQDQVPIFWYSSGQYGVIGGFPEPTITGAPVSGTNTSPVILQVLPDTPAVGDTRIHVNVRDDGNTDGRYVRWVFENCPDAAIRSDVWHLQTATIVDNTLTTAVATVVTGGENETAIKETGKADFVGGTAHGDEEKISYSLQLDGNEVSLATGQTLYGKVFRAQQYSQAYEEGTAGATNWFKAWKAWEFSVDGMEVWNRMEYDRTATIDSFYNCFLCIARNEDGSLNATSAMYGAQEPYFAKIDMIARTHSISALQNVNKAIAWGGGVQFTAEFISGNEQQDSSNTTWDQAQNYMFFQNNTAGYNKMYFKQGYTQIDAGAVTETHYRYQITSDL